FIKRRSVKTTDRIPCTEIRSRLIIAIEDFSEAAPGPRIFCWREIKKMTTIECAGKQIAVEEIEEIGGTLNSTTDYTDTLYRSRDGRYLLEEERSIPVPRNAVYTLPRDREWLDQMEKKQVSVKEISERDAMIWYVDSFLNDSRLRRKFMRLIMSGGPTVCEAAHRDGLN